MIFGDKQNWDGLAISLLLYLRVELVLCLLTFLFFFLFKLLSEKSDISAFLSGQRKTIISSSLTRVD